MSVTFDKVKKKLDEYKISTDPVNAKAGMATVYKYLCSLNLENNMETNAPKAVYPNQGIIVNTLPLLLVK